jgi:hypothetical protein
MRRLQSAALLAALFAASLLLRPDIARAVGCGDYLTQEAAQAHLRADPTDSEGLDPDGNGIACERNPQPYDLVPVFRPGITTPTPVFTPTPPPTIEAPLPTEAPLESEPEDEAPSEPAAEPTATPGVRSPLLGAEPPPLMYLQGGALLYVRPGQTTATPATFCCVQGADAGLAPVAQQRASGAIQPPNTGDGGLVNK